MSQTNTDPSSLVETANSNSDGLVYLATPYSHEQTAVREQRFEIVSRVAADLMRAGIFVYSPISHTHPIAMAGELPKGWDFWKPYDEAILKCCTKMIVLMQDGWKESKGVTAEIAIAEKLSLEIEFMDPPAFQLDDLGSITDRCVLRDSLQGKRGEGQRSIAREVVLWGSLLIRKNQDYGNSVWKRPILAPECDPGVAIRVRMSDKINRIVSLLERNGHSEVDESIDDTLRDLGAYCLLELARPDRHNAEQN